MKQRVADYIADFFVKNSITDIFTITGGGAMHLNDAFGHHPGINCTYNHHEQACAIAAEAYARYSRKLAAVCVTSGPGGINAMNGVAGGWLDSIPMFIVSGQVKFETTRASTAVPVRQLGDQEYNIIDSVKPMTKFACMITDAADTAYLLEKALFIATHGRPGPVWLDIPLNIQGAIVETDGLRHYNKDEDKREIPSVFLESKANEILARIANARRPVIFAGSAVRSSGGYDVFLKLIDKLNIPVVTAWNAHDVLWNDHHCYCGRPGTVGTRGGNFVTQYSDLLLVLGCRLNVRQISYNWKNFAKDAYKIMVDIDPAELIKPTLSIDMPVYADVKDVIEVLEEKAVFTQKHRKWLSWCRNIDKKFPACEKVYYEKDTPVNPYVFMDKLFRNLDEGDAVICGNGSACVCSFQAAYIKQKQRLFTNSGCASMGYGLPAALGVAVERQGKRVICLEGDGSLMMNLQELQTVIYNKLNIKIFVLNNNGYHSIRQTQANLFNPPMCGVCSDSGVSFPDMAKLASAFGFPYIRIDSVKNSVRQIRRALNTDGSVIVEVVLDPEQYFSPKLSSKKLPDGTMVSPSLEDMYPFLPEEEMKQIRNEAMNI
jgi:acetolactate synthase I/II/III large subunit